MFLEKPFSAPPVSALTPQPSAAPDFDLFGLALTLWRRKLYLLMCGLLGMGIVLAIAKVIPHRYTATAELLVDPRDLRVLDKEVTPRSVETDSGITIVESQVAVLSSNGVLKRAIEKLDLASDPEFVGDKDSLFSRAIAGLNRLFSTPKPENRETVALQALKQNLTVIRPERTFVIQLTVSSRDEDKSVRIADAIVAAYLEDQARYRSASNEGAAEAIDAGLEGMKEKVNAAEQKIAAYKADHSLGLASGRLVAEQQLTDTNNQLALAKADTSRIKAQLDDIQSSKGKLDAIPEVVASPALINLKKQLAVASADRARLAAQLLPRHPSLVAVQEQERQIRSDVDQEVRRILTSVTHDYERAQQREDALTKSVQQLQADMNGSAIAQIQLRELERDLEGTRSLYEQSVARSRETREQSRMNTTNIRVISPAIAALNRAFPPRNVILAPLGFIMGVFFGAFLIARSHVFPFPPPQGSPEDPSKRPVPLEAEDFKRLMRAPEASNNARLRPSSQLANGTPPERKKLPGSSMPRAVDALKHRDENSSSESITDAGDATLAALTQTSDRPQDVMPHSPIGVNDNATVSKPAVPVFDLRKVSDLVNAASSYTEGMAIRRLADGIVSSRHGAFARQIRQLRRTLEAQEVSSGSAKPRFVVFTSETGIALKPILIEAFAKSCADSGQKVLIVNLEESQGEGVVTAAGSAHAEGGEKAASAPFQIMSTSASLIDTLSIAKDAAFPIAAHALAELGSYDVIVIASDGSSQRLVLSETYDMVQFYKTSAPSLGDVIDNIATLYPDAPSLRGVILVGDGNRTSAPAVHAAT